MDIYYEFRDFFVNSSNLGLATGIVFGNVFSVLINSLVKDIILNYIRKKELNFDNLLDALILFFVTIIVLFFLIIKPFKSTIKMNDKETKEEDGKILAKIVSLETKKLEKNLTSTLDTLQKSISNKVGTQIGQTIDRELQNSIYPFSL
jgi:large-conductance mechanosensitive channel